MPKEQSETTEAVEAQKPRPTEIRAGRALVRIWTNQSGEKSWRNLTMCSLYKEGEGDEGEWKESHSFGARETDQLIEALEESLRQMGGVGEEESQEWKAIQSRANGSVGGKGERLPDVVRVQSALVKVWPNTNGEREWMNATTACIYQKDGRDVEGHSFARRETAMLIMALREARKLMGTVGGTAETTSQAVEDATVKDQ